MKKSDFSMKMINFIYLSMLKTVAQLPFSGQYWLESFVSRVIQDIIDEYGDELQFPSKKPVDICNAYLNFLGRKEYLNARDYRLEEAGDNLLVQVKHDHCAYLEYCLRAQAEGLAVNCLRIGALQGALRCVLNENYSASIEMGKEGVCLGKLFPAPRPKEEIVTREGYALKIAGRRALLFPQEMYASLLMSVREHAPHALKHVLYDAGYQSGLHTARKARALYANVEECLRFLFEELTNAGFGRVELDSLDLTVARVEIRCYNSFQVSVTNAFGQLYRSPQVICDLLRGIFTAYLSVLLDREIICEEISCQSVGGDYCEFLALPSPQEKGCEEGECG